MFHYENLQLCLILELKLKKTHHILEYSQSQWLKLYIQFISQKIMEAEINNDKDIKALHKLVNNAIYIKTMENFRSRINIKLVNNRKDCLKYTSKPSYM